MSERSAGGRPGWAARIQAEREARSWSFTRAAGHLHRRDPRMPEIATLAKYWAQRWESGRIKPGDRYRTHLCALLRLPGDIFDAAPGDAPAVHCRAADASPTVSSESSPLGEELVTIAADESAEHARRHGSSNVHPVTLDQLQADVRDLAVDFVSGFPIPVMLRARAVRDQIFTLLDGHQWPAQTRQLYSLAGWACGLLAVGSSDFFGRYPAAAAQCRTAWLCAEMSDDDALRAWIRALESGIAFWAGRWSHAAVLASQSREYSRTSSSAMRAATAQARALARLGNVEGARQAITDSEFAHDLPVETDDLGVTGFTRANSVRCAGTAFLWLGDYVRAQTYLREALSVYEQEQPDAYAHLTVARADLASALLYMADLDGAVEVLAPILVLPAERRLAGVTRRLGDLRRQLADPRFNESRIAIDLASRIEGVPPGISSMIYEDV